MTDLLLWDVVFGVLRFGFFSGLFVVVVCLTLWLTFLTGVCGFVAFLLDFVLGVLLCFVVWCLHVDLACLLIVLTVYWICTRLFVGGLLQC